MIIREIYSRLPWKGTLIRPSTTVRIKCVLKQEALEHSEDLLVFIITNFSWNFEASTQFKLNRQWVNFSLSLTNHYKVLCCVYSFVSKVYTTSKLFHRQDRYTSTLKMLSSVNNSSSLFMITQPHCCDSILILTHGWLVLIVQLYYKQSFNHKNAWVMHRFFFRHHDFTKHEIEM